MSRDVGYDFTSYRNLLICCRWLLLKSGIGDFFQEKSRMRHSLSSGKNEIKSIQAIIITEKKKWQNISFIELPLSFA